MARKITGVCPHCGAENRYDATAAGLHVSCPSCGGRFQMDYLRPQRSFLASCLTWTAALLAATVVAGAVAIYYFQAPLPPALADMAADFGLIPPAPPPAPPPQPPVAPPSVPEPAPEPSPQPSPQPAPEEAPTPEPEPVPEPAPPTPAFESRIWVDQSGAFNVTAKLLAVEDGRVRLEKENGETVRVPLDRLSNVDRNYLFEMLGEQVEPGFQRLRGEAVAVAEGDRFTLRDEQGVMHEARLAGLDAPEPGQPYADEARQALESLILGQTLTLKWRERDEQGRLMAVALLDSRSINLTLLQNGWAWYDQRTAADPELAGAESLARSLQRGLWADNNPQPPWEYRNQ